LNADNELTFLEQSSCQSVNLLLLNPKKKYKFTPHKKSTMNKNLFGASALICFLLLFNACTKTEDFSDFVDDGDVVDPDPIVSALVVRPASLRDQENAFQVLDADGNDVTQQATFYIDGTAIEGSSFSSADVGQFEVYAEYDVDGTLVTTDTETIAVIVPKRKVVVEDYTGAWCGYCPRISAAIEEVYAQTSDVAVIGIHNDDEMALPFEEAIRDEFEVSGFPSGRINRTQNWSNPHPAEDVSSIAGLDTYAALSIQSSLDGSDLTVKVGISSEMELSNTKLVVYLLEDGILSEQINYFDTDPNSPFYELGNPIVDFVNDHVLRASLGGVLGDNIPATAALEEYTRSFSYTLNGDMVPANLSLVAMLVMEDNTAINAQIAYLDEYKPYE